MRALPPVFAVVGCALALTACGGGSTPKASKAFCLAADRYNSELERQQERGKLDTSRQIDRVADLAASAPRSIRRDTRIFLDALRRVDSDPSVKDDPRVRNAVDAVNRYANQACGVYNREGGGI